MLLADTDVALVFPQTWEDGGSRRQTVILDVPGYSSLSTVPAGRMVVSLRRAYDASTTVRRDSWEAVRLAMLCYCTPHGVTGAIHQSSGSRYPHSCKDYRNLNSSRDDLTHRSAIGFKG
jgi:hypothetical protein